jgi:hypothetical protein
MAYKIKKNKRKDKGDIWLKDWYKLEKEATKNPFL